MFGKKNQPATGIPPADDQHKGLAEAAFDFITSPLALFQNGNAANGEIGMSGTPSQHEISRLSLHYSSANLSEEESNSLINILDRKKYHEKLAATRSDNDHQTRSSFFEKISTGSNTDSDLRVVRFDGGIAKEREMLDPAEGFDEEDSLPRFKKPVRSN